MIPNISGTKRCLSCKRPLPIEEFSRDGLVWNTCARCSQASAERYARRKAQEAACCVKTCRGCKAKKPVEDFQEGDVTYGLCGLCRETRNMERARRLLAAAAKKEARRLASEAAMDWANIKFEGASGPYSPEVLGAYPPHNYSKEQR
jgi:hypothetical protein